MDWVKRNLYFVLGGAISIILLGLAGWYLYSKYDLNNQKWDALNKDYTELRTLAGQQPQPGTVSGPVDNVKAAREFRTNCLDFIRQTTNFFVRIAPIPNLPKITDRDFSFALTHSIDQMRHDATNASVSLPPDYEFSFLAQSKKPFFPAGTLEPLSVQLGEIKAICDALFQAKVNSLDVLRRERVSPDDAAGNATDYLADKSVTNELAILSPYEITFRCFSPELAAVLSTFASSPNGIVVKTVDVEAATSSLPGSENLGGGPGASTPNPFPPGGFPPNRQYPPGAGNPAYPSATPATAPRRGSLPIVLDERKLRVTMALTVVKLLPPK